MGKIIAITPQLDYGTGRHYVGVRYFNSVFAAGGIPVTLPMTLNDYSPDKVKALLSRFDGILFTGGPDISPEIYGEETLECCGRIVKERDEGEFAYMKAALTMDMPVLAICRGIQVMGVALGTAIYQDVKICANSNIEHSPPSAEVTCHNVNIEKDSLLYDIVGLEVMAVNSAHHQAVKLKREPQGFKVGAVSSEDGIIESIHVPGARYALGVQWHPECLPQDGNMQKLFQSFIGSC